MCRSEARRAHYAANREQVKAKSAQWYAENRERAIEYRRDWYQGNREESLERRAWRYRENLEDERATQRKHRTELRRQVFAHYGTACACCGSTENLSIDHVDGNGGDHREAMWGRRNGGGAQFWRWIVKQGFPPGYQTLCMPCNQSKNDGQHCRLTHR